MYLCFPGSSVAKNSPANERDIHSVPGLERSPGQGNGNPLQYSCLGNPMDREAWWAIVHGVAELDITEHACIATYYICDPGQLVNLIKPPFVFLL